MKEKTIFCILIVFILLSFVFAYNYGEGYYSDSFYGTGYYIASEEANSNEISEETTTTSEGGYAPQTYFSNEKLSTEGNNFSLRYNDKINFVTNFTNHTLTMQNFNTTHAKLKIQSDPLIVWLEKNVSYEYDLDNDSVMDVKVMYEGRDNLNRAKVFIQEIVYDTEEESLITEEAMGDAEEEESRFNWTFCLMLLLILVIVLGIVRYIFRNKINGRKKVLR